MFLNTFSNNGDDLDEDCFESNSKPSLDLQIPLQANAHLYCHASNLQLDYEENNIFDQKTQKYASSGHSTLGYV